MLQKGCMQRNPSVQMVSNFSEGVYRHVCKDMPHPEYLTVRDVCGTVQKVCDCEVSNYAESVQLCRDCPTVQKVSDYAEGV